MVSGAGGSGGGAGGGETPARRCHLRSSQRYRPGARRCHLRSSQPYRHQNVLRRLTESIMNIVPQWLQHYFSRNEDVCTCSTVREQGPLGLENREDDHLICADEESANICDVRVTREPTVSNTEDTATTTTSNCPRVVMRPSLHWSHLNLSVLESPALNSEPSTSLFPTDSSRVSLVKEMKDSASQHDDDNISTTSGVSSRASTKAAMEDSSVPHLVYEGTESCSFSGHTATSSKKTAFIRRLSQCVSVQSIGKSSILQTSQLGNSRFYHVKTRYGGATAFLREPKVRNTPYQDAKRIPQVAAAPLNSIGYTASVPVAKRAELSGSSRISEPVTSGSAVSKNSIAPPLWSVETDRYHTLSKHTAKSSKKPAFNLAAFRNVSLLNGESSIFKTSELGDSPFYLGKTRYGGAAAVVRQPEVQNTAYQVPVRRLMKTKQLNTQSCGVMSLTARQILRSLELPFDRNGVDNNTYFQAQMQKVQMSSSNNAGHSIPRISTPIVESIQGDIGLKNTVPVVKTPELYGSSSVSRPITSSSGFTSPKTDSLEAQPTTTDAVVYTRPAISSFSPGEMKLSEYSKARSSWQCDICLFPNKVTDNKCVTCQARKLPPNTSAQQTGIRTPSKNGRATLCALETGLRDTFKPVVGTQDCDICLEQNQLEAIKCAASETLKSATGIKRALTLPVVSESAVTVDASYSGCTVTTGALRKKFKRPIGSWQCPLCCEFNNAEDKKCVSCMCEKPEKGSAKPDFSFLNISSNSGPLATSATGSTFGSSVSSSRAAMAPSVYGQASPEGSSAFSNSARSVMSQSLLFTKERQSSTTFRKDPAVTPCVSGAGGGSDNTARSGFNFGATSTPSAAGVSFFIDPGPSAPPASPSFGVNQTPTFGQSQGASQPNPPAFGFVSSGSLFCAGSQPIPPAIGRTSSGGHPPVFGQLPSQFAFGSGTAPNSRKQDHDPSVKGPQHFLCRTWHCSTRSP